MTRTRTALLSLTFLIVSSIALMACGPETSRSVIELPVWAYGDARNELVVDEFKLTILEAKIALGPLYFCAARIPSDHVCRTARLELLDPFVLNLLSESIREVGVAHGASGRISSAQYNFGRSILAGEVLPIAVGESVDGSSARFVLAIEGPDDEEVRVRITLNLDPARAGSLRVLGHRTEVDLDDSIEALVIHASAYELFAALDLDELDFPEDEEVHEVELGPGDPLYEALASRISGGAFLDFRWEKR